MGRQLTVTTSELGPFDPVDLDDDELVDGAVLLVRTQLAGATRLVARSLGADWLTRRGMLDEALNEERQRTTYREDDP